MPSSKRAKLRHKVGIGQKTDIKNQVGIVRHAVFVSKAHDRNQNRLLRSRLLFEAVGQVRPQLMNVKFRRVNDQIRNLAERSKMAPLGAERSTHRSARSQRMRA